MLYDDEVRFAANGISLRGRLVPTKTSNFRVSFISGSVLCQDSSIAVLSSIPVELSKGKGFTGIVGALFVKTLFTEESSFLQPLKLRNRAELKIKLMM